MRAHGVTSIVVSHSRYGFFPVSGQVLSDVHESRLTINYLIRYECGSGTRGQMSDRRQTSSDATTSWSATTGRDSNSPDSGQTVSRVIPPQVAGVVREPRGDGWVLATISAAGSPVRHERSHPLRCSPSVTIPDLV